MASPAPTLDRRYLHAGDRVCVAVSGGADSVALLLMVRAENALARNALGVGLSAVHVHHGIRGAEADADLEFVRALCERLDVPLRICHANVPERVALSRANGRGETTEEAARAVRYEAFRNLLCDGDADVVATAHTLEDQSETVLMKLLRGAWTKGLSGIHPLVEFPCARGTARPGGRIVRPLLEVHRADLRDYLSLQGQLWREDSSNSDVVHTRNRFRMSLLPALRAENPAIDSALANLATLAREEETRWNAELSRVLPQFLLPGRPVRGGGRAAGHGGEEGSVGIEVNRLKPLDSASRRRILRAAAESLGASLSFDETERLLEFAGLSAGSPARQPPASKRMDLSEGLQVERSAREIRLSRKTQR